MKTTLLLALAALALSACAPRYYDGRYVADRYYEPRPPYRRHLTATAVPNRYDRDRDNDGVPQRPTITTPIETKRLAVYGKGPVALATPALQRPAFFYFSPPR